jgi:hypothetical protein
VQLASASAEQHVAHCIANSGPREIEQKCRKNRGSSVWHATCNTLVSDANESGNTEVTAAPAKLSRRKGLITMTKNTTASAEITTLNDSDLDQVVGGWGHCGYGRKNYGGDHGYGYGCGKRDYDYGCDKGDYNDYGHKGSRKDVQQTANVFVTVNQIA